MMLQRGFRFRIYPTDEQELLFAKSFGCCRFVYNYFLAYRRDKYELENESVDYEQTSSALTELKREKDWLREPFSSILQQALRDLDRAFSNFFSTKSAYPKFKKKQSEQSFREPKTCIRNNNLVLPKIGSVKIKLHRSLEGYLLRSVTITKKASGRYYASILVQKEMSEPIYSKNENRALGIDYSSPKFYVDQNGDSPKKEDYSKLEKRIAWQNRRLSRMQKGSKHFENQKVILARAYEKLSDKRANYLHTLSKELADTYDYVFAEDLDLKEIADKNGEYELGRATYRHGFYSFLQMLDYKVKERGKCFIRVSRIFPSSQLCHCCGYQKHDLRLEDREWTCPCCGEHHDRDINAAKNILAEGFRLSRNNSC